MSSGRGAVLLPRKKRGTVSQNPAQSDSSSSDSEGECEGTDAMAVVTTAKAELWRGKHDLLDDQQFAHYFTSHEEAIVNAGRAVANAWSRVRTLRLLSQEEAPNTPMAKRRRTTNPSRSSTWCRQRPNEAYIPVLVEIMAQVDALHPTTEVAVNRQKRAEARAADSERATLAKVQRTWQELKCYTACERLSLEDLAIEELEEFINKSESPERRLSALQWICNNLNAQWPISKVTPPARRQVVQGHSTPATTVLPVMIAKLEEQITKAHRLGDICWLGLLSQWIQAVGVTRIGYLRRSTPTKLTASTLYLWCSSWTKEYGKQEEPRNGLRKDGFEWTIPAHFITVPSYNWAKKLVSDWKKVPIARRRECGILFNTKTFSPISYKTCMRITRKAMARLVNNVEAVKMDSWRRIMPTIASAAEFSEAEKEAMMEADSCLERKRVLARQARHEAIRHEVNSSKLARRTKHEAAIILESIIHFHVWEAIPEQAYRQARQDPGSREKLSRAMNEDAAVVWRMPIPLGSKKSEFRLRTAEQVRREPLVLRTNTAVKCEDEMVKVLAKDETRRAKKMPQVRGKTLSTNNKAGQPVCPDFQLGECTKGKECPQGKHCCAVLLTSGRVCGQWHAAQCCENKNAISPREFEEATRLATIRQEATRLGESDEEDADEEDTLQHEAGEQVTQQSASSRGEERHRRRSATPIRAVDKRDRDPGGNPGGGNEKTLQGTLTMGEDADRRRRKAEPRREMVQTVATSSDTGIQTSKAASSQNEQAEKDHSDANSGHTKVNRQAEKREDPRLTSGTRPQETKRIQEAGEAWKSKYDQLAQKRFERKGTKYSPVPPSLIAKAQEEGGELWLGGLPLAENQQDLQKKNISIQVHCFRGSPERKEIDGKGIKASGIEIPKALILQLDMDNAERAQEEWPEVMRLVVTSLFQGDNAYIHCMAGVHRAGFAGVMMRAVLHDETFKQALSQVGAVRQIRPWSVATEMRPEVIQALLGIEVAIPSVRPNGWAEYPTLIHAVVDGSDRDPGVPLCSWYRGAENEEETQEVVFIEKGDLYDWTVDIPIDLCAKCKAKLPASFLAEAMEAMVYAEPA